jgi:hypothetical protein
VRRRRADVDADGAESKLLARDVACVVVLVMAELAVRVPGPVMRVRQRSVGLRRGR